MHSFRTIGCGHTDAETAEILALYTLIAAHDALTRTAGPRILATLGHLCKLDEAVSRFCSRSASSSGASAQRVKEANIRLDFAAELNNLLGISPIE